MHKLLSGIKYRRKISKSNGVKMIDFYCYGMISASTVHILDKNDNYPKPNEYAEIAATLPSVGGEAINSAVALSRLGMKVKFDGNWLNRKNRKKILELLTPYGMDISRLKTKDDFGTEEVIIVDRSTRTGFGNYRAFHAGGRQWNTPVETDIKNAGFVILDPYFRDESLLAAEYCVKHDKPYVTLDCGFDSYIARNAEAVVISHELRDGSYPGENADELFDRYRKNCIGLVIFTFGNNELWFSRSGGETGKYTPYRIDPVDTTGAGDSFRGGIAYGLYKGWDDFRTIGFASAVAANVCMTYQHALNAPDLETVMAFISRYGK